MTVIIGWWIIPLIVTLVAFGWVVMRSTSGGGYADIGAFMDLTVALIVTLISWLVWALLR